MAEDKNDKRNGDEPRIHDKRKIDPKTGEARASEEPASEATPASEGTSASEAPPGGGTPGGSGTPGDEPAVDEEPEGVEDVELVQAEGPDVEVVTDEDLVTLLEEGERDLVAEYRDRAARAEAELKNFRTRVERDRMANREIVIAEVIRSLLPAIDDLDRAEAHGDLEEGTPLALVAQKLRAGFDKYGLKKVGEKGERFDPKIHEALVRLPSPDADGESVADVIEPGYLLGERLLRPAKVAVTVPE